ncbi:hypothetical protein BHE74_00041678, partial [Ensete ventricosum]
FCCSGERATADCVAEAIFENRAELVHLPAAINLSVPLPSKDCPTCDGTGVMGCPECKHKLQVRISADDVSRIMNCPFGCVRIKVLLTGPYRCTDILSVLVWGPYRAIMEPPWKAYNVMRKMDYPYEVSNMVL